jgi:hypothetical protein
MFRSRRRKLGMLLTMAALVALPVLPFTGIPLITGSSAYFLETGVTTHSVHWHWPLAFVALVFVVGIALTVFPGPEKRGANDSVRRTG